MALIIFGIKKWRLLIKNNKNKWKQIWFWKFLDLLKSVITGGGMACPFVFEQQLIYLYGGPRTEWCLKKNLLLKYTKIMMGIRIFCFDKYIKIMLNILPNEDLLGISAIKIIERFSNVGCIGDGLGCYIPNINGKKMYTRN